MGATGACLTCGSTRWRRDAMGEYVCPLGHQYHLNEEMGDTDGLALTQNIQRHVRSSRSSKSDSEYEKDDPKDVDFKYFYRCQGLLKKQLQWLIDNMGFPVEVMDVVKDLWIAFISVSKITLGQTSYKQLGAHHTLVFCHLGAKLLGLDFHWIDIHRLAFETEFPFFNETIRSELSTTKRSMKSVFDLQTIEDSVLTLLSQTIKLPQSFESFKATPFLVLRMFRMLNLPYELYPLYQHLFFVHPKGYRGHTKSRASASVCLFLSKCYLNQTQDFINDYYSHVFSLRSTQIPHYPDEDYLRYEAEFPTSATVKSGNRKVYSICRELGQEHFPTATVRRDDETSRIIPRLGCTVNFKIKSYFGKGFEQDTQGVKDSEYQLALLKIASLCALKPNQLEAELRVFEAFLEGIIYFQEGKGGARVEKRPAPAMSCGHCGMRGHRANYCPTMPKKQVD